MSFKKVAFYNRLCNGCLDFPSRHFEPDQLNIRLNPATQLPCERSTQPSKHFRYDMASLDLKALL